jgi:hypothetical protein
VVLTCWWDFTYPLRCLRVPQVEYHCYRQSSLFRPHVLNPSFPKSTPISVSWFIPQNLSVLVYTAESQCPGLYCRISVSWFIPQNLSVLVYTAESQYPGLYRRISVSWFIPQNLSVLFYTAESQCPFLYRRISVSCFIPQNLSVLVYTAESVPSVVCPDGLSSFVFVGFEVLTEVVMKSTILWDITPCSALKINRRFGGTCRKKPAWKQVALLVTYFHAGFLLGLLFDSEDGNDMFLRNVGWLSTDYISSSFLISSFSIWSSLVQPLEIIYLRCDSA